MAGDDDDFALKCYTIVNPEDVRYPPPDPDHEEDYESDDDLVDYEDGLKLAPPPPHVRTIFSCVETGRNLRKKVSMHHALRTTYFTVDMILGRYRFEKTKSSPWNLPEVSSQDFFITGYGVTCPTPIDATELKKGWMRNFILRAAKDYYEASRVQLNERLAYSGLQDELARLNSLVEDVMAEFLEYMDFTGVYDKAAWLREGLKLEGVLRYDLNFRLCKLVIAGGIVSFINKSLAAKALLLSVWADHVFKYFPVFHPRRFDSVLKHWVSLEVFLDGQRITDVFEDNFRAVWLHNWQRDDDEQWRMPPESQLNLQFKVTLHPVLEKLEALLVEEGPIILGFGPLVPFKLEAKVQDFLQSDAYRLSCKSDRQKYKVYVKLKDQCMRLGCTYLREGYLKFFFKEDMSNSEWIAVLQWLEEKEIIVVESRGYREERRVMLKTYYDAEWGIAKTLGRLVAFEVADSSLTVDLSKPEFNIFRSDPDQMAALQAFCEQPLTVLNGRAGSGKTQVVSKYIEAACPPPPRLTPSRRADRGRDRDRDRNEPESERPPPVRVLLTAPTGKAASVLEKRIGVTAFTLHSVMHSFARNGGEMFSQAKIWVVDECSMVPVVIFNRVLHYVRQFTAVRKIILIGDRQQLPSVDPGNFLGDLYDALKSCAAHLLVELRTNHRSEAEIIVNNAARIIDQSFRSVDLSNENVFKLRNLAPETCFQNPWDRRLGLNNHRTSQIISFMNSSVDSFNTEAVRYYRGDGSGELEPDNRTTNRRPEPVFKIGDKVICRKNADVRLLMDRGGSRVLRPKRLSNGCQFIILEDALLSMRDVVVEAGDDTTNPDSAAGVRGATRFLTLDDLAGDTIIAHYTDIVKKAKLKLAWALTVHKFQGSETDHVTYALTGNRFETCQVVYTAVTRARKTVTLLGTEETFRNAVCRPPAIRLTTLAERVKHVLTSPRHSLLEPASQMPSRTHGGPSARMITQEIATISQSVLVGPLDDDLLEYASMAEDSQIIEVEEEEPVTQFIVPTQEVPDEEDDHVASQD